QRFLDINQVRLQHTRASLSTRQQVILDILPLLFHVNHPLLPGFSSRECPYKLANYEPDEEALFAAQRYSKTFKYREEPRHSPEITGIFLMGSTGTIAHSEQSDMDVWLCHEDDLDAAALTCLQTKAESISAWADELGLELHFFLMNDTAFRNRAQDSRVDSESSGSAQHFLLLDEFYRTSLYLCGKYPLWWLIPPDLEQDYATWADRLITQRFIKGEEYLDFGGLSSIPKEELVGAGLWQLYKGIDSPYKSVLKLLLNEVYAQELPEKYPLSLEFKAKMYAGVNDTVDVDPYIMIYRRLEQYLGARSEKNRLTLVRKSFYLKIGEKLTHGRRERNVSWRRVAMQALVNDWGWQNKELTYLDKRQDWRVSQVLVERKSVVSELTHCYRFISQYARQNRLKAAINVEDMNLLGRKLYAAFQRKAGKLEFINPNIAPDITEESLGFHHASSQSWSADAKGWLLYKALENAADAAYFSALKRSTSLVELITWSHYNGLLGRSTRLGLLPGTSKVTLFELRSIIESLQQHIQVPFSAVAQARYKEQPYAMQIVLFINVGMDPLERYTAMGVHKLSSRNDSLGYSSVRDNLVLTLDQVTRNSWNEVLVNRYELGDTLIQCLKNYLAQLMSRSEGQPMPELSVKCFCQSRATAIARRVEELFVDVAEAFFGATGTLNTRYIIELDRRFFAIQFFDQQPRFTGFESIQDLLAYLSQPQREYTRLKLDRYALTDYKKIRAVCAQCEPDTVQVFFYPQHEDADVYILDEKGSLFAYNTPFYDIYSLLIPLQRFLLSIQDRRQMRQDINEVWMDSEIVMNELVFDPLSNSIVPSMVAVEDRADAGNYFEVQAIGNHELNGELEFDIFCDQQEFTTMEYGDRLIPAVAHFILSRRHKGERYPCYITDLGLPHDLDQHDYQSTLQTVQYLFYKQALESALNEQIRYHPSQDNGVS
ncbi:MAG: class I adenylate cyclase, partial [Pseudomonadales bacterium]|nr:class I adenylate cyclase [Pseudomonadales bacterium]